MADQESRDGLPPGYWEACRLAEQRQYDEARRLYAELEGDVGEGDGWLRALIRNDRAVLAALEGRSDEARRGWAEAREIDAACLPARLNDDFLAALLDDANPNPGPDDLGQPLVLAPPPGAGVVSTPAPHHEPPGPIKVAILSFLFNWPSTGGGNIHTVELAQFLGHAGYDVRQFYARFPDWGIGQVQGVLPYPAEALDFDPDEWELDAILVRYRVAVERFDPDCVIVTDSWNIKPFLAQAVRGYPYFLRLQALECLCPLNNVRLLMEWEGGGVGRVRECPNHQLARPEGCARCLVERGHQSGALHQAERALCGVGSREYDRAVRAAFAEAEAVLVVNPLHEAMVGPYARAVHVVTAGIDPARFPCAAEETDREDRAADRAVVLFAGLVDEPMKGFAVLHEAGRRLRERRQDFVLVATADPPGTLDEFTELVGWQSQADLPDWFRRADVVVFPTIAQEALGRTAVEAMAAGRPVVASRIGGLPFTVAEGATGLLCRPGDPDDLAAKLATLLDDPALRRRMGRAGRRRFEEDYAWDVIVERHYRPLLKRRERGGAGEMPAGGSDAGKRPAPPRGQAGFTPEFPRAVDHSRLLDDVARLFDQDRAEVEHRWHVYSDFHRARGYARTLGEFTTLSREEAFVLAMALGLVRPATIVEVGTQHGKSTRRILDLVDFLGLESRLVGFDVADAVEFFTPGVEAELVLGDLTGRFRRDVLEAYQPGLIFLDVHAHGLLSEAIRATLAAPAPCVLAIHDCGQGLCNPRMTLAREDPNVTSSTGVWERHVLAEVFGVADPLDPGLDGLETPTHRLRIFATTHGLGVVVPVPPPPRRDDPARPGIEAPCPA